MDVVDLMDVMENQDRPIKEFAADGADQR